MTPNLKKHIVRLGENLWKPYREDARRISECADVLNYWPEEEERPEGAGPLRYIAIRTRKRHGEWFADGSEVKYFAVGRNRWDWEAARLLEWQREKAGTIEALHDVLKNDLAAGVMPCGRFGANALWLRGGHDAQRTDRAETVGTAREMAHSATEAAAVSDLLFTGQTGLARSPDVAARSAPERSVGRADRDLG